LPDLEEAHVPHAERKARAASKASEKDRAGSNVKYRSSGL